MPPGFTAFTSRAIPTSRNRSPAADSMSHIALASAGTPGRITGPKVRIPV